METMDSLLKFIGSYPAWAKSLILVGIGISIVTLVFAPREGILQPTKPSALTATGQDERVFMKLKAIQLFPDDPSAEVQVVAYVNGTEYVHPSVGGVKWMKVGPDMSEKVIELPKAAQYTIRFEMNFRSEKKLKGATNSVQVKQKASSQWLTPVIRLPFSEEYKLYLVKDESRAASVKAVIPYEIYRQ